MEKIIDPVSLDLLLSELTPDKKLCNTNKGGNVIYVVDAHDSPNVMQEIGRLREISFREGGGGSGLAADIDEFDTMEVPYKQIVVWDPDSQAILGGYRYILGPDVKLREDGQPILATTHMFRFSDVFIKEYLPHVMELGRSFVTPEYQSSRAGAKAIYALDNLWDAIGAVVQEHPGIIYFFGKMTMYPSYDRPSRDLILHFLWKHFPDPEELVRPIKPVMPETSARLMDLILKDSEFKDDYRNLKDAVRKLGTNIPPLVNSYMNSSPSMKMLGTAINDEFSDVEETGIMVCYNEMYPEKRDRHTLSSVTEWVSKVRKRFPKINDDSMERLKERRSSRKNVIFERFKRKRNKS
ncbi:MAG: GNAT family N-acetyltransferase [Bacteroidales bacterium]|nr:GNAT family N-acetyltransferase [Bacteroidales bacterium]